MVFCALLFVIGTLWHDVICCCPFCWFVYGTFSGRFRFLAALCFFVLLLLLLAMVLLLNSMLWCLVMIFGFRSDMYVYTKYVYIYMCVRFEQLFLCRFCLESLG